MEAFSTQSWVLLALIFIWAGFVRTGLGFGGAALGLPLMLLVGGTPLYWLPIIGMHLLFFSSMTLFSRWRAIDWSYIAKSLLWILPASLFGVAGVISLPAKAMALLIYGVSLFYALVWLWGKQISSNKPWLDKLLLIIGGYVAGTSLTGAPLIVAVYLRHVDKVYLRNSLLALWFLLVTIKLFTLAAFAVPFDWKMTVLMVPVALIGHVIGLKLHDSLVSNDARFKQVIGGALALVSVLGLWKYV